MKGNCRSLFFAYGVGWVDIFELLPKILHRKMSSINTHNHEVSHSCMMSMYRRLSSKRAGIGAVALFDAVQGIRCRILRCTLRSTRLTVSSQASATWQTELWPAIFVAPTHPTPEPRRGNSLPTRQAHRAVTAGVARKLPVTISPKIAQHMFFFLLLLQCL